MRKSMGALLISTIVAGISASHASPLSPNTGFDATPVPVLQLAQYGGGLCSNWQQQCARLYGWQSQAWHNCMRQPQALYDCGRGGGGGYAPRGGGYGGGYGGGNSYQAGPQLCGNWQRQCARYYGAQTPSWYDCMNQPQARYACGGQYGQY